MKICQKCNSQILEESNVCQNCGSTEILIIKQGIEKESRASKVINPVLLTVSYLCIYAFFLFIFINASKLGKGLGNGSTETTIVDFLLSCESSMFLAFIPCVTAIKNCYLTKNHGLLAFNLIFLIFHLLIYFGESYIKTWGI